MAEVKIWYDREGDFLEVTFEDAPGYLEEIDNDIFERRATHGRIIGLAVYNFSRHDRENLRLPLRVTAIVADQTA